MYDREILTVLADAGDNGLKVSKIARHVFNNCNSFFETHTLEEVHKCVVAFIAKNSRTKTSLIEKTRWGVYRINRKSPLARQLLGTHCYPKAVEEEDCQLHETDPTLPLFDDETLFFLGNEHA